MTTPKLHREVFSISRKSAFFEVEELQVQTGVHRQYFGHVVVKELMDNALDAAESQTARPEVTLEVIDHLIDGTAYYTITVEDNGAGIPPEVVKDLLDFDTHTSDKRTYRSITRGQQGNALQTIMALPTVLGGSQPIVIAARGIRHTISVAVNLANEVKTTYVTEEIEETVGTKVTVSIPGMGLREVDPDYWARAYALVNPHAVVRSRQGYPGDEPEKSVTLTDLASYMPKTDKLDKPDPTSQTSPHWYDTAAMAKLISGFNQKTRQGGRDKPFGEFIREFKGLSSPTKAALIRAQFPNINHLSDFNDQEYLIGDFLSAMKAEARVPKAKELGQIDLDIYEQRFEEWYGTERVFKRRGGIEHDGVAWGIEVVVAETGEQGGVFYAVNYAPTYNDPLTATELSSPGFEVVTNTAGGFLTDVDAHPHVWATGGYRAVIIHITCPAPQFLDKGKTMLSVPDKVAVEIGKTLWLATNTLYKEMKAREASGKKRADPPKPKSDEMKLQDAVFLLLNEDDSEAIARTSGDGAYVFPQRNLFYSVRDIINERGLTTKKLESSWFDGILLNYKEKYGAIPGLYRDPRGNFHEPHIDGKDVPLGTLEVEAYQVPEWRYIRVAYIEKEGVWPAIKDTRIPERFDMAWAMGKGRPTEAVRNLFDLFDKQHKFELYVFVDADESGYGIAKNMREATRRMPDYNVDVIHVGLTVQQAIDLGMRPETYDARGELDSTIEFNDIEREWFEGERKEQRRVKGKQKWFRVGAKRVELNKFSMPDFIAWVERRLTEEIEARGGQIKMQPPADVLKKHAEAINKSELRDWIIEQLEVEQMATTLAEEFKDRILEVDLGGHVESGYTNDDAKWWKEILSRTVRNQQDKYKEDLLARITNLIEQQQVEEK